MFSLSTILLLIVPVFVLRVQSAEICENNALLTVNGCLANICPIQRGRNTRVDLTFYAPSNQHLSFTSEEMLSRNGKTSVLNSTTVSLCALLRKGACPLKENKKYQLSLSKTFSSSTYQWNDKILLQAKIKAKNGDAVLCAYRVVITEN